MIQFILFVLLKNFPSARDKIKDDDSFGINGFDNWKNGLEKFKKHEKSENHFFTFKCWQNDLICFESFCRSGNHKSVINEKKMKE
jgi:hypothetical protein